MEEQVSEQRLGKEKGKSRKSHMQRQAAAHKHILGYGPTLLVLILSAREHNNILKMKMEKSSHISFS